MVASIYRKDVRKGGFCDLVDFELTNLRFVLEVIALVPEPQTTENLQDFVVPKSIRIVGKNAVEVRDLK